MLMPLSWSQTCEGSGAVRLLSGAQGRVLTPTLTRLRALSRRCSSSLMRLARCTACVHVCAALLTSRSVRLRAKSRSPASCTHARHQHSPQSRGRRCLSSHSIQMMPEILLKRQMMPARWLAESDQI